MQQPGVENGHENFVIGVYNYCDRWCGPCAFNTRCRLHRDLRAAEAEAAAHTGTDGATSDGPVQVHHWLERALDLVRKKADEMGIDAGTLAAESSPLDGSGVTSLEYARLQSRANSYFDAVVRWQRQRPVEARESDDGDPAVPQDVIDHLALLIGSKVHRAVEGRREDPADVDWIGDSDGSAKVAILSAERSLAAWTDLRDSGLASDPQIDSCRAHLAWLIAELDRLFPKARSFVRPGFDE